jgi:hypothetical protein
VYRFKQRRARKPDPLVALFVTVGLALAATLALQINAQADPGFSSGVRSVSTEIVQSAD